MTPQLDLQKIKKVHFIGIGGIGISAIAHMMLLDEKIVSGSDMSESPITRGLVEAGAKVTIGQSAENISEDFAQNPAESLVVYTVAIKEDNPELAEVRRRGLQALTYPQMLAVVSREKFTIAVAGSHGKTTTTAMIANILIDAGLDPTVIVGSIMKSSGTNFVIGKSKYFVVEACEYSRSFLNLHPQIAVVTNIDDDHLDYYGDIAGVQKGFQEFVVLLPSSGSLVCDPNGKNMVPVAAEISGGPKISNYSSIGDREIPSLKTPGTHNVENAKAALAVARLLGVKDDTALRSLENFSGTWRRFEFLGQVKDSEGGRDGALVYDDYAHHPTEIRATIASLRKLFPDKKIALVFQPHLYSRTKEHLEDFASCFNGVDTLLLAPIYAAREPTDPSISSEILAEKIRSAGIFGGGIKPFGNFSEIVENLKESLASDNAPDVIMTMGAGDINTVALDVLK